MFDAAVAPWIVIGPDDLPALALLARELSLEPKFVAMALCSLGIEAIRKGCLDEEELSVLPAPIESVKNLL